MVERSPSLARVVGAFVRRDARVAVSYRTSFLIRPLAFLTSIFTLALMARFVGEGGSSPAQLGSGGFLGFWLTGIAVAEVYRTMATGLAQKVRSAQLEGTLEAVLGSPASTGAVLFAMTVGPCLLALVEALGFFAGGVLICGVHVGPVNAASAALALSLALVAFATLGLLGAAITMRVRQTDPVTAILTVAGGLIGSVLFPASVLPPAVHAIAYALPLAPALDALRPALFAGASPSQIVEPLAALAVFIGVALPGSALLFFGALRRAREDGSLGHY